MKPEADVKRERPRSTLAETMAVMGLLLGAIAVSTIVGVAALKARSPAPERSTATGPDSILPDPPPYSEFIRGRWRELADGRIEVRYDFIPEPRQEGKPASEMDIYPQLRDWNMAVDDTRGLVGRGEGRFYGSARGRIAFEGPVELLARMELRGPAAIRLATNTWGEGYELRLDPDGKAELSLRKATVESAARDFADLAPPEPSPRDAKRTETVESLAKGDAGFALSGRALEVIFSITDSRITAKVAGETVIETAARNVSALNGTVSLHQLDPNGQVAWDEVVVTGVLSRDWMERRLEVALELTGRDSFEPDDRWALAREILPGDVQHRTFSPNGDVDWVSVATLDEDAAHSIRLRVDGLELGARPVLAAFELDGKTRIEPLSEGPDGLVISPEGRRLFYLRIVEMEGRRGAYQLVSETLR